MTVRYLPEELTDLIIDKIPESYRSTHTPKEIQLLPCLSSLSLVSHSFRTRVNHHRFHQLSFATHHLSVPQCERLLTLRRLLCQRFWSFPEMSIQHHVRSLQLYIVQDYNATSTPDASYTAEIIESIVNHNWQADKGAYELSVIECNRHSASMSFNWSFIDSRLAAAIENVFSSHAFTTLRIMGFTHVPLNLGSRVASLVWRGADMPAIVQSRPLFQQIKRLDIKHGKYPLKQLNGPLEASNLEELTLAISEPEHLWSNKRTLEEAVSIHTLKLEIHASEEGVSLAYLPHIRRHLIACCPTNLTTLRINHRFVDSVSRLKRSAGGRVVDLLQSLPATALINLHTLVVETQFNWGDRRTNTIAELLHGHGCIELADFLATDEFSARLQRVGVYYILGGYRPVRVGLAAEDSLEGWRMFERSARSYLSTYFSELHEKRPLLKTDIRVLDRKGWLYDEGGVMLDTRDIACNVFKQAKTRFP